MDGFPSGQRERTVNPLSQTTMVRIHPRPPKMDTNFDTMAIKIGVQFLRIELSGKSKFRSNDMEFRFGPYALDIDIQKTRLFYQKANNVSVDCSCASCRNFEKAVEILPDEIKYFFDSLGINMKKPAEVYASMVNDDGLVSYGGFYHLCGRLLSGESAWVTIKSSKKARTSYWDTSKTYSVSKDLHVSFQEDCALVEDGFPEPVLQMEIEANIPWVLEEPNPYI